MMPRARVHRNRNKWLRVCSMFEATGPDLILKKRNLNKLSICSSCWTLPSTPKASADLRLNSVLGTKSWCPFVGFTLVTS